MIEIGTIEIEIVSDGLFALDGGSMFGVVPKNLWQKIAKVDEENRLLLGLNCLLIKTAGQNILVDVGIGANLSPKMRRIFAVDKTEELVSSLNDHIAPENIDIVILTHLHFDHIGGLYTKKPDGSLQANFPNARILIQEAEYEAAFDTNERTKGSYQGQDLFPLQASGQVDLIAGDYEVCPGVRAILTGGHSAGHQIVTVTSQGETLVFWGDLIPTTHHLRLPYVSAFDVDPQTTVKAKKYWIDKAVEEQWVCLFEHNPKRKMGYIIKELDNDNQVNYRMKRYFGTTPA